MKTVSPDRPRVILTFDDSVRSHATTVAPLLQKFGFGATFYITEFKGEGEDLFSSDKNQYMTWEQIAGLHSLGFEIGNHTATHALLNTVSGPGLLEEIEGIERKCAAFSIPHPRTFCYPAGIGNDEVIPLLQKKGYLMARSTEKRFYVPGIDSVWQVPSFVIQDSSEALFYETLDDLLRDPAEKIAVFTFHGVPDWNHPWVTTQPERFSNMMRFLYNTGLSACSMRDFAPSLP